MGAATPLAKGNELSLNTRARNVSMNRAECKVEE